MTDQRKSLTDNGAPVRAQAARLAGFIKMMVLIVDVLIVLCFGVEFVCCLHLMYVFIFQ